MKINYYKKKSNTKVSNSYSNKPFFLMYVFVLRPTLKTYVVNTQILISDGVLSQNFIKWLKITN